MVVAATAAKARQRTELAGYLPYDSEIAGADISAPTSQEEQDMRQANDQGSPNSSKRSALDKRDHKVAAGVGAVAGAVGAGAAVGTVAGPVGTVLGAAAGAVVGGLGGKVVAETIDRDGEDAHWRMSYRSRPYVAHDGSYDDYGPAYRYGVSSFGRNLGKSFDHVETDLSRGWNTARGNSKLAWDHAKLATRDAWDRLRISTQHSK